MRVTGVIIALIILLGLFVAGCELETVEVETVKCSPCDGTGRQVCAECEGTGDYQFRLPIDDDNPHRDYFPDSCEDCEGRGDIFCDPCDGSGRVEVANK